MKPSLALFPTGRGARLAFRTVTHVSTAEMDLSFDRRDVRARSCTAAT